MTAEILLAGTLISEQYDAIALDMEIVVGSYEQCTIKIRIWVIKYIIEKSLFASDHIQISFDTNKSFFVSNPKYGFVVDNTQLHLL